MMMRWIDRDLQLSEELQRYEKQSDRAESQALFQQARAVYEQMAATASRIWGD